MRRLIVTSSFVTIDTCSVKNVYLQNLWLERHKNFSSNKDIEILYAAIDHIILYAASDCFY